jgi:AmmeMemoRadiSam system protein A
MPLSRAVQQMAVSAAVFDSRFYPLTVRELDDLGIEISVLSSLQRVTDVAEIEIGKHGLLIVQGGRRGLLLPQVASERGWDRETFLEALCAKADLSPGSWRRGAVLQAFTAEIFNAHYGRRASAPAPAASTRA